MSNNPTGTVPPVPPAAPAGTPADAGIVIDGKTFTQEQYNRHLADRAERAERAALEKLVKDSGFASIDELKAAAAKTVKLEQDQLSESEKLKAAVKTAQDEAAKAKADAVAQKAASRLVLMRAQVTTEASAQNVDPSELGSLWMALQSNRALLDAISDSDDGTFTGVKEAVTEIAKQHPRWLKDAGTPQIGTPAARQQRGQGVNTAPAETLDEQKAKLRATGNYSPV